MHIHEHHRHTRITDADDERNGDEENFKPVKLDRNTANSNNSNSPVEHSCEIQDNHMVSYKAPIPNVMDPNSYNAHVEQCNGVPGNHTTLLQSSEQNIMNPNVEEDISTEDLCEILFGPPKQHPPNPNTEDNISVPDHYMISSEPLNQNVANPNTFDNLSFVGAYGDSPIDQVNPNGQLYMSHPQDPLLLHCQRIFSSAFVQFSNVESN